MREIKFKLIKDNKIVGYEYHMKCLGGVQIEYSVDNHWGSPLNRVIVHDVKKQFTGLKDKNEVEIYEGDIVKFQMQNNEKDTFVGKIIYDDIFCSFRIYEPKETFNRGRIDIRDCCKIKVIGNIHEVQ